MIFKLTFPDRIEYAQAQSMSDCLDGYAEDYSDVDDIEALSKVSAQEAKTIIISNRDWTDFDPEDEKQFTLESQVLGDHFLIIATTGKE